VRSRVWQERTTPGWATVGSFRWMMMMISSFSFSVFLGSAHLTQPTKHLEEFWLIFLAL
jgi:hypothetical protein